MLKNNKKKKVAVEFNKANIKSYLKQFMPF